MTTVLPAVSRTLPCRLAIGRHRLPLPRNRALRMAVGIYLIVGGLIPLLPPGPGGIALGFAVISMDYPGLRRFRRKAVVRAWRPLKRWLARRKGLAA